MARLNRWLILVSSLCWLAGQGRSFAQSPPNVLLIITDEHNFRTLGCYRDLMSREQGHMWGLNVVVPTPHIDQLADDGVICTRAYATAPVCTPCRAAMMTGLYPHATGAPTNDLVLDRSIPTLADRLNDAGYRSGFIGKWHLGGKGKPEWAPEVDGGFQFKKFMFNRGHWKKFLIEDGLPRVATRRNGKPNYNLGEADEFSFSTDWLTDRTIDFVSKADASKPFFAVLSYPDPHGPNTVRSPYDHRFDDLPFEAPRTFKVSRHDVATPGWAGAKQKHDVFRGPDMSKYFGMVQCIDDNIGRLVASLKESGQLDNTVIVFTSDHGDLCYEHDRLNKGNPYEGSARVPMILRYPVKISAGRFYTEPVGTVDVAPTVLGFLGLPAIGRNHGRDLSSSLTNLLSEPAKRELEPITFLRSGGLRANWVAAVDSRHKLILSVADEPWLFDAQEDPDELINFSRQASYRSIVERLARALYDYKVRCNDPSFDQVKLSDDLNSLITASDTLTP